MRFILLALMIGSVSLLSAPAAAAAPGDSGEYFAEYKLGGTTVGGQATPKDTPELLAGYRWSGVGDGKLGFELGYVDFGAFDSDSPSITQAFYGTSVYTSHALKLGANYDFPLGELAYLEPRAGLMRLSYRGVQHDFPHNDRHFNETKMGHYVGVGLGFWVAHNFALSLNLDVHNAELFGSTTALTVFSVGAQIRF